MDWSKTQSIIDAIPSGPTPPPPDQNSFARAGQDIANLPGNILSGVATSAYNLTQLATPGPRESVNIPNFFDVPPATSTANKAVDFFLGKGGMADQLGQFMVPAGVIGKVGAAAGMAEGPGLEAMKWAGGFAMPDLDRPDANAGDVAASASLGAAQGALSFLPRKLRILPTAAVALAHGLYEGVRHDDTTTGVASGLIDFGAGMLPGSMHTPDAIQISSGDAQGPSLSGLDDPQNPNQFALYKQQLAQQEAAQASTVAQGRSSLKDGVRLINGGNLQDQVPYSDLFNSFNDTLPEAGTSAGIVMRRGMEPATAAGPIDFGLPQRPGIATFSNGEDRILISPSTKEPGKFQATKFIANDEPTGHETFDSYDEAVQDVLTNKQGWAGEQGPWPFRQIAGDKFATLQTPEATPIEGVLPSRQQGIVTGVEPRPDVQLQGLGGDGLIQSEAPQIQTPDVLPNARTADEARLIKNATRKRPVRKAPAVAAPDTSDVGDQIATLQTNPDSPVPVEQLQPEGLPPEAQPVQAPTGAYAAQLRSRYSALSPDELKSTISDLDSAISTSTDPNDQAGYYSARTVAQDTLDSKMAPPSEAVEATTEAAPSFSSGDRVTYTDAFGQEQHGTYKGVAGERAKVRFDGDSDNTLVSHSKLKPAEGDAVIPELATLQNAKSKGKLFDEDDESALSKFLADQPDLDVDENDASNAGQDFKFETRQGVGPGVKAAPDGLPRTTSLPTAAVKAVNAISDAIKNTVSRHLDIKFKSGESFSSNSPAHSLLSGKIGINVDKVIEQLDGWHNMGASDKAYALANVARWIGHETGHTILNFMAVKNPAILSKLIREFDELGVSGRMAIVKDFHDSIGYDDKFATQYAAGAPWEMSSSYDYDPKNKAALDFHGLHEFFAEMSAAHIFGKLKEDLLPPEMQSFWGKLKGMLKGVINRLFNSDEDGATHFDNVDQQLAYNNFHDILSNLHDRFSQLSEADFRTMSEKSEQFTTAKIAKLVAEDDKIKRRIAAQDYQAQVEKSIADERAAAQSLSSPVGVGGSSGSWNPESGREEYADGSPVWMTKQSPKKIATLQNQTAGQTNNPIIGNRAFIESQLIRQLGMGAAGAIAGGYLGPKLTDGQMTIAQGMFAGGVLGLAGPVVLRRLLMTMPKAGTATFQHIPPGEAFQKLFTLNNLSDLGGDAATGQGSAPAKFVRWMERNMNLHLPPEMYNAMVKSEGPASYAIQIATDAFEKARTFETNPQVDAMVQKYLGGKATIADLRSIMGPGQDGQDFANFIVTGRSAIGQLQEMVASGLKEGSFKQKVLQSLQDGNYLTHMYRIFQDTDYKPNQTQIEAVSLELSSAHPEYDLSTARNLVEDYLHQIEIERQMFSGGKSDVGRKLDSTLFSQKNDRLSAAFRDMLGQYDDPKEQIMGTLRHLYTNAISSKFYDEVANMKDGNGLKFSYGKEEQGKAIQSIQAQLAHPPANPNPQTIATLQKQLKELQYFVPLEDNVRYGKLGGQMVNRFVRDQLASFDNPWGLMDGAVMRSLSKFNNYVKIGKTAVNPITVIRNIVSVPALMAMGRANPFYTKAAWAAMRDMDGPMGREMLEQGIFGVDQVRGEFFRSADQLLMGDFDHNGIEGVFKSGMNKVLEFYRLPDMITRGTTYITAKKRFSSQMSLPETDSRVIDAARNWTNRYTVNYANVAPIVKSLRQIPFANLFISFTAEMTRISKNLVQDVYSHPDPGQRIFAAGALGAMAGVPLLMEKASVNALSPKDKIEWENTKSQMPDQTRDRFQIVLGKDGNRFRYLDITPSLHTNGLLEMFRTVVNGDWKAFAAVNPVFGWENTPALSIVADQISGQDLQANRPLNTFTRRVLDGLKQVEPPLAPGGYEFQRISDALSVNDQGTRGLSNQRTGRQTTPSELVESYLTGIKMSTVDPAYVTRGAVLDAKQQIANEMTYYRDIAATNLPDEIKQKAAARYQSAVQNIIAKLNQRLGVQAGPN